MDISKKAVKSRLKISEDVIITVARLAGEVNKISKIKKDGPIKVSLDGDVAAIEIKIKINSNEKACAVAQEVQKAVKENVQNMTGVAVARVNVTVCEAVFK